MDAKFVKENFKIQSLEISGKLPDARSNFAYAVSDNGVILHGGHSVVKGKTKYHNDFLFLDTTTQQWRKVFLLDAPKARELHALARINNDLYLYGGSTRTGSTVTVFEDFWKFELENVQWHQDPKKKSTDLLGVVAEKITMKTLTPGKRHSHALISEPAYNMLILFGGFDGVIMSTEPETASSEIEIPELFDIQLYNATKNLWIIAEHFGN